MTYIYQLCIFLACFFGLYLVINRKKWRGISNLFGAEKYFAEGANEYEWYDKNVRMLDTYIQSFIVIKPIITDLETVGEVFEIDGDGRYSPENNIRVYPLDYLLKNPEAYKVNSVVENGAEKLLDTYIYSFEVIKPIDELETVGEILGIGYTHAEYCPENSLRGYRLDFLLKHPEAYKVKSVCIKGEIIEL